MLASVDLHLITMFIFVYVLVFSGMYLDLDHQQTLSILTYFNPLYHYILASVSTDANCKLGLPGDYV